jgi:hypothetical protein
VADTVDASLRARCFASLKCIPTLTLICHFIDAIKAGDFARAESVRFEFQTREDRHEYVVTSRAIFAQFAPSDPADILKRIAKICRAAEMADARVIDLFRRCDPIFVSHRVESTDHGPDRSRPLNTSLPAPPREHEIVSVRSAFAAWSDLTRQPNQFCRLIFWKGISMTEELRHHCRCDRVKPSEPLILEKLGVSHIAAQRIDRAMPAHVKQP